MAPRKWDPSSETPGSYTLCLIVMIFLRMVVMESFNIKSCCTIFVLVSLSTYHDLNDVTLLGRQFVVMFHLKFISYKIKFFVPTFSKACLPKVDFGLVIISISFKEEKLVND